MNDSIFLASWSHWQICLAASGLLLQGAVVAVFPEEIIITALGVLWREGRVGFLEALLFCQLGVLPANFAAVLIGRNFGPKLLGLRWAKKLMPPEKLERALAVLRLRGSHAVFITRFTPTVRGPVYFAAGLARLPLAGFARVDWLASCLQIPALLSVGFLMGSGANSILDAYRRIAVLFIVMLASALVWQGLRKAQQAQIQT